MMQSATFRLLRSTGATTYTSRKLLSTSTPPVFPWRSSPILLQRLQIPDDLSGTPSQALWSRWARQGLVARQLQVDWLRILMGTWKHELAADLEWAFQKGLAGVLSHVLKVPMDKIDKGDGGIDIDTSKLVDDDFKWTDQQSQDAKDFVKKTLQDNLWSKYTTSFWDRSTHDLQLKLQPMNYALEHAFVIPVITREAIAKDSKLLDTYHDLDESIIHNESSYDEVKEQVEALIKKAGGSRTTFTLVVDMSIECREQFCVTEKESGTVVQGTKDEENTVLHLVRFEMVLTKLNTFGSWIISDWDDMLGGNVWHLRKDKKESSSDIEDDEKSTPTGAISDEKPPLAAEDAKNDDDSSKDKPPM